MAEDELVGSGALGDAPDLGDIRVQRGHPFEFGTCGAVQLEIAEVGHVVDQNVRILGEGDQIVVHGGVAGEHHRAVRSVETVRQSRNRMAVGHCDGGDLDDPVFEDDDRNPGGCPVLAGTGMSIPRTSAPASGMRASSGMTFRW